MRSAQKKTEEAIKKAQGVGTVLGIQDALEMRDMSVLKKPQNVIQKTQNKRQGIGAIDVDAKIVPYGTHNQLRDYKGPPNITNIVKANSKPGHGKMVVSSITFTAFNETF